jgi:MFS family permease
MNLHTGRTTKISRADFRDAQLVKHLALSSGIVGVAVGVILWGLHMSLTQGLLATLVVDTTRAELRGTAYGMFSLMTGFALLAASVIAGGLWDVIGPKGHSLQAPPFHPCCNRPACYYGRKSGATRRKPI